MTGIAGPVHDVPATAPDNGRLPAATGHPTLSPRDLDPIIRFAAELCSADGAAFAQPLPGGGHLLVARTGIVPEQLPPGPDEGLHADGISWVADLDAGSQGLGAALAAAGIAARFLAEAPVIDDGGQCAGVLFLIAAAPRPAGLTMVERHGLELLAGQILGLIRLARARANEARQTQRLRARQARLTDSRRKLAELYRSAPVGLYMLDRRLRCRQINPRMIAMLGISGRENAPLPAGFNALMAPAHRHVIERGETLTDLPVEYLRDGADAGDPPREFLASLFPLRRRDGRTLGLIGAALDVTAALAQERRLREAEERYRLALGATRDAIWDWDLAHDRIIWSDGIQSQFGHMLAGNETPVDWWTAHVHDDDRARVVADLQAKIDGTALHWSAEYRFARADGSYAMVLDRGTLIRDEHGRVIRAIGAILDQSERKAAEAELRETQEDLLRVSRLTAMGAVASTLAHELNQPLTACANYLALLRTPKAEAEDGQYIRLMAAERATAEILRASEIVRRIRRFASTGELSRRPEPLAPVIWRAWESVRQLPGAQGMQFEVRIDSPAAIAAIDRVQIEQVLNNLMRNAVEAMAGRPDRRLVIAAMRVGEQSVIRIADNGPGLTAEMKTHLFEPFRTTKASGLGLGLPLCRTIVEAHGGRIWAEDGADGGTVFAISLPEDVPGQAEPAAAT
ncbi:PAS domain-containing protein [Sphingomonas changnyeongensis]|uniref:histidine kinase n=1 Tax=Sphingomonas changnyeongensis TaxID=2698679 RepID=A0A7Z2S6Y1_9SPHN|nr:ATP-binding protein [Sphingomonas changnyeongensis]QHL89776.1 PAS domain-containing protein [Sphingomonas changnyeongensis]